MTRTFHVAVVGASGAVGREMLETLEQRDFPVGQLTLLASERSAGEKLTFRDAPYTIKQLTADSFEGVEIALFSAGGSTSRQFAPIAAKAGAVVIDNSSAWRMDDSVPLLVPEVNPEAALTHKGIIANPNCSTIQMVVALAPIHKAARIRRIVVSTYQSASGAGKKGMDELADQTVAILNQKPFEIKVHHKQLAFNCVPHIGSFLDNGYTDEEMKLVHETRKIMGDDTIEVSPTAVRVPVFCGHSEAVNLDLEKPLTVNQVRELLRAAPGVVLVDDPKENGYPVPIECPSTDDVFVGRIRRDPTRANVINLWVVSDNLRKGAALNAVQIAELLVRENNL
ncbi:MAG: aspartate-semialdehyde dehydrogenase [Myxococcales bacterium]|nr:aspartate-semialdehyde dehydrogenase [Myxococcales bacterium]